MPEDDKKGDWLERAVRIGTLALGATYAAGFIVVNAYYAQYGVTDFSFVKARILAAGILFFGLAALAFLIAAGIFGVAEVRQNTIQLGDTVDADQLLIRIAFYYSAVSLVSTSIVRYILCRKHLQPVMCGRKSSCLYPRSQPFPLGFSEAADQESP